MNDSSYYSNIRGIHLELTTKCNAMCPMCNRNYKGKVRSKLPIVELSLDDIKKILKKSFLKQINLISLCGVYGEPICNKDLKEIIKYFVECNKNIKIDLYTNGSLYDIEWWKDLASIMNGYNFTVIFGIDGDGDTHSIHRCNTNYNKIIENAKSFIYNGGNAQWDYIVFKHNEHQVEQAYKLSKELGFKEFQVKKTSRFLKKIYEEDEALDSTILDYGKHPVYNNKGEIIYCLELPTNEKYKNASETAFNNMIIKYETIDNYLDKVKIECNAIKNGGIFISAEGLVFPCCTVYQQVCYKTIHDVKDEMELNEYKLSTTDNLSAFENSIKNIVTGNFFSKLFTNFNCKTIKDGKPKSCSRTCGKDIDYHKSCHTTKLKYEEEK